IMPARDAAQFEELGSRKDLTGRVKRIAEADQARLGRDQLLQFAKARGSARRNGVRDGPCVRSLYRIPEQKVDRIEDNRFVTRRQECLTGYIYAKGGAVHRQDPGRRSGNVPLVLEETGHTFPEGGVTLRRPV